jgi:hypothetical protein
MLVRTIARLEKKLRGVSFFLILGLAACSSPYDAPRAPPGRAILVWGEPRAISSFCRRMLSDHIDHDGCAFVTADSRCTIFVRQYASGDVLNHEEAHCRGWQHPPWP